ncbi:MAG: twin-arginine translocase TatA/TatE family subunit [Acidimicrobiales bacterium]
MLSTIFSGSDDLIVILVAFVVLFGGSQLPKLAKNTGEALREFRKAHSEAEAGTGAAATPATPVAATVAAPVLPVAPAAPVVTQAAPAAPATSEYVTVTRAELDALLAERAAHAQAEGPKTDN